MSSSKKKKTAKKTPRSPSDASAKERAPRRPPLVQASRLVELMAGNATKLHEKARTWQVDAAITSAEQRVAVTKVLNGARGLETALTSLSDSLAYLQESGYVAKVPKSPGRKSSIGPGTHVALKPKRYDPEVHGDINDFEVASITEKGAYKLRPTGGDEDEIVCGVPRAWIEKLDVEGDAPKGDAATGG